MLRGTECSGIFLKVTLVFMGVTNGQTLQCWKILTFSLTFVLPILSSDFSLMHAHHGTFIFLKLVFWVMLPPIDCLTLKECPEMLAEKQRVRYDMPQRFPAASSWGHCDYVVCIVEAAVLSSRTFP